MGRRRKEFVEAGLCGKGLHPWVDGSNFCHPCRIAHDRQRQRKENPAKRQRTTEQREAGVCSLGIHPWVDGQERCADCRRAQQDRWRQENAEHIREKHRQWVKNNPDHKEKKSQYMKQYYRDNEEEIRRKNAGYRQDWLARNRDKTVEYAHRRRARKHENGVYEISPKDKRRLLQQGCQHAHLGACGGSMEIDHIVPVSLKGRHSIGNLQMLCSHHNRSKSNRLEAEVRVHVRS